MSDYFEVSTDYILKRVEPVINKEQNSKNIASKILYISSTAFVAIGLFCALGSWYEYQIMTSIFASMIIQVIGIIGYCTARILSKEKIPFYVNWLNIIGLSFIPISMITGYVSGLVFKSGGWISPYPVGLVHILLFGFALFVVLVISRIILKK